MNQRQRAAAKSKAQRDAATYPTTGTPADQGAHAAAAAPPPNPATRVIPQPPPPDAFRIERLRVRLEVNHAALRRELVASLRYLSECVDRGRRAIEAGEPLDPHLIVNASGLSETIARWNLVRDLLPYVEVKE